jgi:hypothetical protein
MRISQGNLIFYDGYVTHAYPILSVLILKYVPIDFFIMLSPFAMVASYLFLYFMVSKKIIYFFPFTILIPLFYSTFTTSTIDWLLLPIVYHKISRGQLNQSLLLGLLMVYIHGFVSLYYLVVLYAYLGKFDIIGKLVALSLPQLLPLVYFSQEYTGAWLNIIGTYTMNIFWNLSFTTPVPVFRFIVATLYIGTFISIIRLDEN